MENKNWKKLRGDIKKSMQPLYGSMEKLRLELINKYHQTSENSGVFGLKRPLADEFSDAYHALRKLETDIVRSCED